MTQKKKIAFLHRYGLEGWICCGGHAIPGLIAHLSKDVEIHFYGPHTPEKKNPKLRSNLRMHELPYTWNRTRASDKITKTILWYFWLPLIGIRCRLNGTKLIWNDETVPLTAPILQIFYGKNIAITVMDFFMRIYTQSHPRLHGLRDLVERIDLAAWRKLPLIFTKVLYTQEFLAERGISKEIMHLYRNPVDHTKFHPVDKTTRQATRAKFGFSDSDLVLTHHGILHPNKGNDWILHQLASPELKSQIQNLKFLLIGDGPEMDSLKQLASKLHITDRVVFTGWLPTEEDLNNALASADIGLVMRIGQETDHFHMTDTLAHEMACGKPILTVNLKGIAEIIENGENGFLFSFEQPASFQENIRYLSNDYQLRSDLGIRALELSRKTCDTHTSSLELTQVIKETLYA